MDYTFYENALFYLRNCLYCFLFVKLFILLLYETQALMCISAGDNSQQWCAVSSTMTF